MVRRIAGQSPNNYHQPHPATLSQAGSHQDPQASHRHLHANVNPQDIRYVHPRHINAAKAFCNVKPRMREANIDKESLLQGIRSENVDALQIETDALVSPLNNYFSDPDPDHVTHELWMQFVVAEGVADCVNTSQTLEVNKKDIRDTVIKDIRSSTYAVLSNYARNHPKKVAEAVNKALATAEALRPNQNAARQYNLQARINSAVPQLQHRAFLSGANWGADQSAARDYLIRDFTLNDVFGRHHPSLVTQSVDHVLSQVKPEYTMHPEGARFKAFKSQENARLDATQIRSASGRVYALINTPTAEHKDLIWRQHSAAVNVGEKTVIGKGGFGKVRYALDLESGEIVAVKKFSSHRAAKKEWCALKALGDGPRFVDGRDYAHVRVKDGSGATSEKSYIFTSYANVGDGITIKSYLRNLRVSDPLGAQQYFRELACEYAGAAADMHERGVYHHDIKPDNFLHSMVFVQDPITGQTRIKYHIKIADYGLVSCDQRLRRNHRGRYRPADGTHGYFPPEGRYGRQYRSSKHDAFSLGITLLEMKLGVHPFYASGPHLSLPGGATVTYIFGADDNCTHYRVDGSSVNIIDKLPLDCENNIIARLLHRKPKLRITPQEAYQAFIKLL